MKIPGIKRTRQTARWFRSRYDRAALILGYHRVANVPLDPFSMCIKPQHFAEHLRVIRKLANPISLSALLKGLREGNLPERAVVLTIDDGYIDVLYEAAPLLARFDIPMTVFITAGYLGQSFWWDELAGAMLSASDLRPLLKLCGPGAAQQWHKLISDIHMTSGQGQREHLLRSLYLTLRSLEVAERRDMMRQISENLEYEDDRNDRVLTDVELAKLGEADLIEIGSHSQNHIPLAELPPAVQQTEIQGSKNRLQRILGYPVVSFSYPNGSLSATTAGYVANAGFVCACTSATDVVRKTCDRFLLPRFWPSDISGQPFGRWLFKWL